MTIVSQYSYRLDPSNNMLLGEALERVFSSLNFGPRDSALAKLPSAQELKWEAEINSVLGDHVDAAFTLGWQAAKNPASWLFGKDSCLVQESPSDVFSGKMAALGLGYEDVFNLEGELGDIVLDLVDRAETLAFALGWELQRNPDSLIFEAHTLCDGGEQ